MSKAITILALCDSPEKQTGFARVAQNLFSRWAKRGATIDVWGIGYTGVNYWKCPYVRRFYPAAQIGGEGEWASPANLSKFLELVDSGDYTHVWMMQDTFQLSAQGLNFPEKLREYCTKRNVRSVYYFPVDAPLDPDWTRICQCVDVPVAYTEYGKREAEAKAVSFDRQTGQVVKHDLRCEVIPHGVDTAVYYERPHRAKMRAEMYPQPWFGPEDFVMVNVSVNQRRKDVLRSLEICAGLRARGVPAKLLMHMANRSGDHMTLTQMAGQLGLQFAKDWGHSNDAYFTTAQLPESEMHKFYSMADLFLTTTLGEGWGLPAMEALACGTPIAMPDHTACGEIGRKLREMGMHSQVVLLPVEFGGVCLSLDNSRLRKRVNLASSISMIENYYKSGEWKKRGPLSPQAKEWMDWDRIAGAFWKLMKGAAAVTETPASVEEIRDATQHVPTVTSAADEEDKATRWYHDEGCKLTPAQCRKHIAANWPRSLDAFNRTVAQVAAEIPLLGVPVYNRGDLLERMVRSIDFPVWKLFIVHNCSDNPNDKQEVAQTIKRLFDEWSAGKLPMIDRIEMLTAERQMGVAGAWNRIVKATEGARYTMLVANDMQFTPGDLEKMHRATMAHLHDKVILFGNWGHNLFTLTPLHLERVGTFDENIYPAYLEDCDHMRRLRMAQKPGEDLAMNVEGINAKHGEEMPTPVGQEPRRRGSCTIYSDAKLMERNAVTQANNFTYYRKKWGGINEAEVFTTPFNIPDWDIKEWHLDPELRKAQLAAVKFEWGNEEKNMREPFRPNGGRSATRPT